MGRNADLVFDVYRGPDWVVQTPLQSGEMERFGLWPKTRRVQLTKLEEAGLVKAEKAAGKKPVVRLLL